MRFFTLSLTVLATVASYASATEGDGFHYEITHPVECERKTQRGDKIEVHYRGILAEDGSQFDASYDRGTPMAFTVGTGQVIKGWDEGLLDMCVGEKRHLVVKPEAGYGDRTIGPIPAGSTLIFDAELMSNAGVPTKDEL